MKLWKEGAKATDWILQGLKAAADLLLPRVCLVCGERLLMRERILCIHCFADLPLTRFWERRYNSMADRFNSVVQHGLEETWERMNASADGIAVCRTQERYVYAAALFFYSHEASYRHILYDLKYEGRIDAGKHFGRMLGARLVESAEFEDADCVIPVPLHWARRWMRGYNQAEVIAKEVAAALDARLECRILYRRRRTKTQTRLDIKNKAANVEGAFQVHFPLPSYAIPKHILLIDDVFTTGSTLHACFVALRSVFPPSVRISVATLAFVGGG